MKKHNQEDIAIAIETLYERTDSELVHMLTSAHSRKSKMYEPLIKAIEKERKSRGTATTITSKPVQPKLKTELGVNPDDY